tara:strand:- start:1623 stop:1841 length:219 start_codon:yes stop_codon:yes gene_type:complete
MNYYIIPQDKIESYLPLMKESFKHNNVWIRMNLSNTEGLMEFTDELAPEGYTAYSREEIQVILITDAWQQAI